MRKVNQIKIEQVLLTADEKTNPWANIEVLIK
jgi:hypothetical protein